MRKWILASVAAAALAGAGFAFAAPPDGPPGAPGMGMGHHEFSPEHAKVMLDWRIGGMKAALKLTADQEKLWGPFEAAVRDVAKSRDDAMKAMREHSDKPEAVPPIDRMNQMAEHMAKMATQLKQVADAAKPLYDSLNEPQKGDFGPLLSLLHEGPHGGPEQGGHRMGGHMGGDGDHHMPGHWGPQMDDERE